MRVCLLLCLCAFSLAGQPRTAVVTVNPDGMLSPQVTYIRSGDRVRWERLTSTDSIIPVTGSTYPGMCREGRPFEPNGSNEFTGPMTFAPSGVFTLSSFHR